MSETKGEGAEETQVSPKRYTIPNSKTTDSIFVELGLLNYLLLCFYVYII